MLIFEGALRKWVFPGLATPLLIVRDPVALYCILNIFSQRKMLNNGYVIALTCVSIISFFTAVTFGHGNLLIAFYGIRIFLIHFPMIFIIGSVFTREDIIKLGKVTLWISIPMLILIALQFYSPQSAWVNRGVGGDIAGAGYSGSLGYFRPPGTFSFTTGNTLFFGFVATFIFYFLLDFKKINKALLILSLIALLLSVPLSISRTLFFSILISLFFLLIGISRKPKFLGRAIVGIFLVVIAFIAFSETNFFQTATEAFTARLYDANEVEGGLKGTLGDRYFGGMFNAIANSADIPFFGYGIGLGTNVGSMLLTGQQTFLIAEGEWGRLIGEMGFLLGLLVILIRLAFSLELTIKAYKKISKGDLLPWMLLSFALLNIPQGQWAQPTSLGFSIMSGGLVLASLNHTQKIYFFER